MKIVCYSGMINQYEFPVKIFLDHQGQGRGGGGVFIQILFLWSNFSFCQIEFVCIDLSMCDLVHNVETVFHLH